MPGTGAFDSPRVIALNSTEEAFLRYHRAAEICLLATALFRERDLLLSPRSVYLQTELTAGVPSWLSSPIGTHPQSKVARRDNSSPPRMSPLH